MQTIVKRRTILACDLAGAVPSCVERTIRAVPLAGTIQAIDPRGAERLSRRDKAGLQRTASAGNCRLRIDTRANTYHTVASSAAFACFRWPRTDPEDEVEESKEARSDA